MMFRVSIASEHWHRTLMLEPTMRSVAHYVAGLPTSQQLLAKLQIPYNWLYLG
jgi:hypothetical protein